MMHDIDAKSVDAAVEPEAHTQHRGLTSIAPIEVGLFLRNA
jgi:hypothetical protein